MWLDRTIRRYFLCFLFGNLAQKIQSKKKKKTKNRKFFIERACHSLARLLSAKMFHLLLATMLQDAAAPAAAGTVTDTYNATQVIFFL
jgi:hypothetical protein